MKVSDLYNSDNFDFSRLQLSPELTKIETANSSYAFDCSSKCTKDKVAIGLTKEIGYKEEIGISNFIKQKPRLKYYRAQCRHDENIKTILVRFFHGDLPEFVRLDKSDPNDLADAFVYLQKGLDKRRERIIVFEDVDQLTTRGLGILSRLVLELKGSVGILLTMSNDGYELMVKKGANNVGLIKLITNVTWEFLAPPSLKELRKYCLDRGVLNERIIKSLIEENANFELLEREINSLAEKLREKGYLE